MNFIRLFVIGFVALTVIYVMISLYSRSVRKERLENEWDAAPQSDEPGARDAFIAAGLAAYRHSLRRRLILLVYVVPVVLVTVLTYLTNEN